MSMAIILFFRITGIVVKPSAVSHCAGVHAFSNSCCGSSATWSMAPLARPS
jgi:hypothetical protein